MIIKGIVINSFSYGDSSKIIRVLTNSSVYSILIKGASNFNSKLNFLSDYYCLNEYEITESTSIATLLNGEKIKSYNNIFIDFDKYTYASKILFALKKICENEVEFIGLLDILTFILEKIDDAKTKEEAYFFYNLFLVKMLDYLGISPNTEVCNSCLEGNTLVNFDVYEGKFLCRNCTQTISLYFTKIVKIMVDVNVRNINYTSLTNYNLEKLEKAIKLYIQNNIGIYL